MPLYPNLPSKPAFLGRWDSWGDGLDAIVRQLVTDVSALIAAPAAVARPSIVPVRPASATAWPKPGTRVAGDVWMWLRAWDATTLAPMPATSDGYLTGDLVYPVQAGENLALAGPIFSDSCSVPATVNLDGRTGDAALGGSAPTWRSDLTEDTVNGRARLQPGTGLELYSRAYGYVLTPKLPLSGDLRFTFTVTELNVAFALLLRTSAYNASGGLRLKVTKSSGNLVFAADDATSGSSVLTTLGQVPWAPPTTVVVTVSGSTLTVVAAGKTLATYAVPVTAPRATYLAFKADMYNSVSFTNVKVEAL